MTYVVLGLIWLSVTSLSVTIGRMVRPAAVAYPVAAVASFGLLSLLVAVAVNVPALALLLGQAGLPASWGSE
jgi:hypothetical protein